MNAKSPAKGLEAAIQATLVAACLDPGLLNILLGLDLHFPLLGNLAVLMAALVSFQLFVVQKFRPKFPPPLALFLLSLLASALWSQHAAGVVQVIKIGAFCACAWLAGNHLGPTRSLSVAGSALAIAIGLSLLALLAYEGAVHQFTDSNSALAGNWRGLFDHKNKAGWTSAAALPFFVAACFGRRKATAFLVLGAALVFLFQTGSKTSITLILLVMPIAFLLSQSRAAFSRKVIANTALFALLVGAAMFSAFARDDLITYFSDPRSFTGRMEIWQVLLAYAADHPLLGSGYGGLWDLGAASPLLRYTEGWALMAGHGHNQFMDVLAQAGIVSAGLFVWLLCIHPPLLVRKLTDVPQGELFVCNSIFLFVLLNSMLESSFLSRSAPLAIVWTFCLACLHARRSG